MIFASVVLQHINSQHEDTDMKIFNRLNLFAAAIALVFAGATMAQQSAEDFAPPAEETIDVSDQQLEQFADAQVEIGSIQEDYRSEEHTSELQSRGQLVCRLLLEKKKTATSVRAAHSR